MTNKPTQQEMFAYLDKLQDSGVTNMWGASPYLHQIFEITNMSYRSDLVLALSKKAKAFMLVCPAPSAFTDFLPLHEDFNQNSYYKATSMKWHDSYEDIKAFNVWLDKLTASMGNDSFGLMRLGEEFGDIQEWGCPADYNIFVEQKIDIY